MEAMTFNDGLAMLNMLHHGTDLYNVVTNEYVFEYNELGSIAVYGLVDNNEAKRIAAEAAANGEYWGAYLGIGGRVYDTREWHLDRGYDDGEIIDEAETWCNQNYNVGTWILADSSILEED